MFRVEEQETVIQFDPVDNEVHVMSTMPVVINRWRKIAGKNGFNIVRDDGDLIEINVPKDRFSFGAKVQRKCTLSEEQKAKNREFFLEMNRKRCEEKLAASQQVV